MYQKKKNITLQTSNEKKLHSYLGRFKVKKCKKSEFSRGSCKIYKHQIKKYLFRIIPFVSRYIPLCVLILNPKVSTLGRAYPYLQFNYYEERRTANNK